ncbi:hypothetical protein SC377_07235 [Actinotignum sp. SLA_B059]|uniref:hypothetical protein n=1 Tax=Actinotignum sp. SLA_B059 TaxID=3083287 RepID=UPI002A807CF8|nr:hypothetical protein [Actinotignum sp. SLA_B059]MDY5127932.1 hypothetical protein [Actinotignum sp. SLA_B059]
MKKLKTLIATTTALAIGWSGTGIASASEMDSGKLAPTVTTQTATSCSSNSIALTSAEQEFTEALTAELERFNKVTNIEDTQRTAAELYPGDTAKQQEYIDFASEPLAVIHEDRAIPAIVLAAIPVIAACVVRGLSGAALDQVVTAIRGGDLARADDLIWSFGAGCVGWGPLKWAYNKAKPVAARALTWAVKQALKVAGKFH